jgi:hypothetical protein
VEPITIGSDYSRHPIPGQTALNLHAAGERSNHEQGATVLRCTGYGGSNGGHILHTEPCPVHPPAEPRA